MVVIYNRVALWPVTPMATVKGKVNLNCCWYLLMTWRSHPTCLALNLKTLIQKYVLYLLCATYFGATAATVADVIVFTIEK
jgi:hypothetical protein